MPRKYNKKMNNSQINSSALLPKLNHTDELTEFEIRMYNNSDVNYIGDRDNGIKKIFVLDDEFCSWYALDKLETKRNENRRFRQAINCSNRKWTHH